jgi:hypothetical protein
MWRQDYGHPTEHQPGVQPPALSSDSSPNLSDFKRSASPISPRWVPCAFHNLGDSLGKLPVTHSVTSEMPTNHPEPDNDFGKRLFQDSLARGTNKLSEVESIEELCESGALDRTNVLNEWSRFLRSTIGYF